jgi:uncharacterized protein (TIGR02599 family)
MRRDDRRGYTLIEVLVTVAILALLALVTAPLTLHLVRFFRLNNAKLEIQRDARVSLDTINRFLRQANSATVVIGQQAGQPSHSRIDFTTYQGRAMSFYQQGRTLYQVAGSTSTLSNNLRFIGFSYPRSDDPTILSVAVTMEHATYQGRTKVLELSIQKVRVMN